MIVNQETFPDKQRLWQGAVLGSVAHGIMVSRYPELSHEQSWDGMNYNVQDSMGSRGTVSFSKERLVGVFFDARSPRNPFLSNESYDLDKVLRKMPAAHRHLAEAEALQYVLQDYRGERVPIVTAALWSEGARLAAAEPWRQAYENGAHLIRIQLLDTEAALKEWQSMYGMSPRQLGLVRKLFEVKLRNFEASIVLGPDDVGVLLAEAKSSEGLDACRESLAEIGIGLP